jgi:hypothetical protein
LTSSRVWTISGVPFQFSAGTMWIVEQGNAGLIDWMWKANRLVYAFFRDREEIE